MEKAVEAASIVVVVVAVGCSHCICSLLLLHQSCSAQTVAITATEAM